MSVLTGDEWWRPLPRGLSRDARRILAARSVRGFADGFMALLLPIYLLQVGFGALAIGSIVTCTLLGSAVLTLLVGLRAQRHSRRRMLAGACLLMAATGSGLASSEDYWWLLVIAFIGTVNPTAGDVSVFLPLEHTVLAQIVEPSRRTALFARYGLVGTILGALGTLAAALPDLAAAHTGLSQTAAIRGMFWLYGALGLAAFVVCRGLSPTIEPPSGFDASRPALGRSARIVYRLAALFSLDALGSGFFVQSLLALWLYRAFHLSVATASSILFWSGICSAISYLIAVPISERLGLINTMVFTHLPSNLCLMLVPFAPTLPIAIGLLLARSVLSQMDVPARTSYVMAVVAPEERPAAASVTALPRSLATAASPLLSGYLLSLSVFGWPLVAGGLLKAIYDLLLLANFRNLRPEEEDRPRPRRK